MTYFIVFPLFLSTLYLSIFTKGHCAIRPTSQYKIVIDAGHGGSDCGAHKIIHGKKICEKDLTLNLAKEISQLLTKRKIDVFLTRDSDTTLSLERRAYLTDKHDADLFISIHMNSHSSLTSHGFETFYLDNHKDKAIQKLEEIENNQYKGEQKIVHEILNDFLISRTAPASLLLAKKIHTKIKTSIRTFQIEDRGIKPGLFYVLALTKRPAVLLEAGFLSHKDDAQLLKSDKFKSSYARGVVSGIIDYLHVLKKREPKQLPEIPLF